MKRISIALVTLVSLFFAQNAFAQHSAQIDDGLQHYSTITANNPGGTYLLPPGGGTLLTSPSPGSPSLIWLTDGNTIALPHNIFGSLNAFDVIMEANGVEKMRLVSGGGVNVSSLLTVTGAGKFKYVDGNQTAGWILMENGTGVASWVDPGTFVFVSSATGTAPITVNGDNAAHTGPITIALTQGNLTSGGTITVGGTGKTAGSNITADLNLSSANIWLATQTFPAGSITNAELANSSINFTYGTGISGPASIALGGSGLLTNTGVTSLAFTGGTLYGNIAAATGAVNLTPVLNTQTAATVFAGPTSGVPATPTFRALANTDLPGNGTITVNGSTGLSVGGSPVSLGGTLTLTNTGVTSNLAGAGISVSGATGAVTIGNTGILGITGSGAGINVTAGQNPVVTNTGVTSNLAGAGISVSGATGAVTIGNTGILGITGSGAGINVTAGQNPVVTNTGVTSLAFTGGTLYGNIAAATGAVNLTPVLNTQTAATVFAGPTSGVPATPTFRALTNTDLPGNGAITVNGGTGLGVAGSPVSLGGTLTLSNTGVTSNLAGAGISVSGATGAVTIGNTGILGITGSGAGINVTAGQNPVVSNTGVTSLAFTGGTLYGNIAAATGAINLTPALNTQTANTVFAGPTSGIPATPTFRALTAADLGTSAWTLIGNSSLTDGTNNFLGTTDNVAVRLIQNNNTRVAFTTGGNIGIGLTNPNSYFSNTSSNIRGSDGQGASGSFGFEWASAGTVFGGYAMTIFNSGAAAIGNNGLAVKVAGNDNTTDAFDVSQNATAGTTGTALFNVRGNGNVNIGVNSATTTAINSQTVSVPNIPSASASTTIVTSNGGNLETRSLAGTAVTTAQGTAPITVNGASGVATSGAITIAVTTGAVSTPGSTLTLGGTGGKTVGGTLTADINLSNANTWLATQTFPAGSITNAELANSSINFTYGTGISGPASIALGGSGLLTNTGVTSLAFTGGTLYGNIAAATGAVNLTPVLNTQTAATVFAGPTSGVPATPTFRALANTDLPGNGAITVNGSTGLSVGGSPVSLGGTLTLTNTGVTSNLAGAGISVSGATGAVTIGNTGILGITGSGAGINVTAGQNPVVTNTGVTSNLAGAGISVSGATGAVTITNIGVTSLAFTGGTLYGNIAAATGAVNLTPALNTQTANTVFAGPGSGVATAPTFRALVLNDLPGSGAITVNGGTGLGVVGSPVSLGGTLTLSNTGVTSNLAGAGISVSGATGAVTIGNTGILGITGSGAGINVTAGQNPVVTNTGVTSFAFTGGTLYGNIAAATGAVNLTPTLNTQTAATVFAGPTSGVPAVPTFRTLANTDLPGNGAITVNGSTGLSVGGSPVSLGGTLTLTNTGVTSNLAGAGISVSGATGAVTIGNTGILGITGSGAGINVTAGQNPVVTNTGVTSLAFTGGTLYGNIAAATGAVNLTPVLNTQTAATVFAGPTSGVPAVPTFRTLANTDLPGNGAITVNGSTGLSVGGSPVSLGGTLTLTNTGVTSNLAGAGISVSGATGAVTIGNTGILGITGSGAGINVTAGQNPVVTNTGVTSFAFTGGTLYGNVASATGAITLAPALNTQTANTFFAGPGSGAATAPTFRAMVSADIPAGIVANSSLANSTIGLSSSGSLTVTGSPISLGGAGTVDLNLGNANTWTGQQTISGANKFKYIDGNQTAGWVLTEDATGQAIWSNPTALGAVNYNVTATQATAANTGANYLYDISYSGGAAVFGNLGARITSTNTAAGGGTIAQNGASGFTINAISTGVGAAAGVATGLTVTVNSGDATIPASRQAATFNANNGFVTVNDGNLVLNNTTGGAKSALTFYAGNATHFATFKAPTNLTADATYILPLRDATASGQTLSSDGSGNLSWRGSYNTIGSWSTTAIPNGALALANIPASGTSVNEVVMPFGGSLASIGVSCSSAFNGAVGGQLHAEVYLNNVATGLFATINAASTQFASTTTAVGNIPFNAGDRISIQFSTNANWASVANSENINVTVMATN